VGVVDGGAATVVVVLGGDVVDVEVDGVVATVVGDNVVVVVVVVGGGATRMGGAVAGPAEESVAKVTPATARVSAARPERTRGKVVGLMPGSTEAVAGSFPPATKIR
jgi:hypothetical protein